MNSDNTNDIGTQTQENVSPAGPEANSGSGGGVGDLISQVEQKMTDLMSWHKEQSVALEAKRAEQESEFAQRHDELERARQAVADEREAMSRRVEQLELDRQTLKNNAQSLLQEQAAVAESWKQVIAIRKTSDILFEQIESHRKTLDTRTESLIATAQDKTPEPKADEPVIVVKQGAQSSRKQNRKAKSRG